MITGDIESLAEDVPMDQAVQDFYGELRYYYQLPQQPTEEEQLVRFALWMGSKGAYTNAHYDSVHNFYLQIYGTKRFFLFPPAALEELYLFPRVHPNARQSRIDFNVPPDAEYMRRHFPKFIGNSEEGPMRGFVIDLQPGQLLYLPPGWFHSVLAVSTSISVSMWQSSEDIVAERIILDKFEHIRFRESAFAAMIYDFLKLLTVDSVDLNPMRQPKHHSRIAMRTPAENIQVLLDSQFCDYPRNDFEDKEQKLHLVRYFSEGCRVAGAESWKKDLRDIVRVFNVMPSTLSDLHVFSVLQRVLKGVVGADSMYPFLLHFAKQCKS